MNELKVFVQENCPICSRLKEEIKKVKSNRITIIEAHSKNEGEFEKYRVLKTPVSVLVNESKKEINRFYGVKTSVEILEFLK